VEVFAQAFSTQKAGNSAVEYEDAYWPQRATHSKGSRFRFAVADGATETSYSGIWARQLVKLFCFGENAVCADFAAKLPAAQRRWRLAVSWRTLPWYAEAKVEAGAFAALLGLQLSDECDGVGGDGIWQAIAIGDCCLVHLRGEKIVRSFPMENSHAFNNRPVLLASNSTYNASVVENLQSAQGCWISDDAFYLMTDALAAWFLLEVEKGGKPWTILRDLGTAGQTPHFIELVRDLRAGHLLRNDDVTLRRVDIVR
jgi:hypothetical protein